MNKVKRQLAWILGLSLGGLVEVSASTIVLFDNLDDLVANGAAVLPGGWVATGFTTGESCPDGCSLGDITLKLNAFDARGLDSTDGFALEVVSDAGTTHTTSFPGTTTIATMSNPATLPSGWSEAVFTVPEAITLAPDTLYWAKLISLSDETEVEWLNPFDGGGKWAMDDGIGTMVAGEGAPYMMRVAAEQLAPVPLPAALWLMGTALAGLAMRTKRAL